MAAAGKGAMRASREFPSNEPVMWPKIFWAMLGSVGAAWALWRGQQTYLVPRLGGEVPKTLLSLEHQTATHKRYGAWPREAAEPCFVNPFRHDFPPWAKNMKEINPEDAARWGSDKSIVTDWEIDPDWPKVDK